MKKLVVVVIIILAVWFGITWFTSNNIEPVFDDVLAESNQQLLQGSPLIKIEKQSFNQGFFSSTARSVVSIDADTFDTEQDIDLTLQHIIYHGPVMITPNGIKIGTSYILTTLDQSPLSGDVQHVITLLFAGEEPFVSGTLIGFGDSINEEFKIATMRFDSVEFDAQFGESSDDEMLFILDGLSGHFAADTDISMLKGTLDVGAITLEATSDNEDVSLMMSASHTDIDIDQFYRGVELIGTVIFKTAQLDFSDGDTVASLTGLNFTTITDEENGLYTGTALMDIDKISLNNPEVAETPEASMHMMFSVSGLEQQAVKNIIDAGNELQQAQYMIDYDSDLAMAELDVMMAKYFSVIAEAIKQGVTIDNVIEVVADKGTAVINFDLTYIDTKKLIELQTVKDFIMALKGQLKINIDKSLIAGTGAEMVIDMPIEMGFAVDKGDNYESLVVLNDGIANLNGLPMPLLDMLGPTVAEPLPWIVLP